MKHYKSLIILALIIISSTVFAARVRVLDQAKKRPYWVDNSESIGRWKKKKVIFFVGMGYSKFKGTAQESAKLKASTEAAVAIKNIATKQVAKAWQSMGVGDKEEKEQVMKVLEASSSKKVNVSGLIKVSVWWRYVMKPKYKNGRFKGYHQPVYEYYYRYALDYDIYKKRLKKALEEVKKMRKEKKVVKKEDPKKPKEIKKEEDIKKDDEPEEDEEDDKPKRIRIKTDFNHRQEEYDDED